MSASDSKSTPEPRLQLEIAGEDQPPIPLPAKGRLVIGSSEERAQLVLTGQGIDETHCAIGRVRSGGWAVKDLGSAYGTLINGQKVDSARLSAGDVIVVGSRRLLVAAESAGAADEAPSTDPAGRSAPAASKADVPQLVDGFVMERRLGRGGMGEVFLATQESLNRHVALKILNKDLVSDRDFVLRFHSEARSAAALSHPNVVVVHDVGEADGHHYLVMEYMPGGSLEDRVAEAGRIPWRETLDILHDAANGLTYAEETGIVHRDIKPDNLMVAASGAVKIADLGLATPVADQVEGGEKTYGTPHFISPEHARGLPVDHRSDLYSLGATAYRLLSGKTPFSGATTRDIVRARFHETPPSLKDLVPGMPSEVEDVVTRLMALDPEDRFATASELLHEIDGIRLRADHGEVALASKRSKPKTWRMVLAVIVPAVAFLVWAARSGESVEGDTDVSTAGGARGFDESGDAGFFGDGNAIGAAESDEEQALRVLELEAQLAYRDLASDTADRVAGLESIVERFGATRVAEEAQAELDRIEQEELDSRVASARAERDIAEALTRMKNAAGWPPSGDDLPKVGDYLQRLGRYQVSVALAASPDFEARRAELIDEVLTTCEARLNERLADAEDFMAQGDFDALPLLYDEVLAALRLPDETDDDPAALTRLREMQDIVQTRRVTLGSDVEAFRQRLLAGDRAAFGGALGPESGWMDELSALAFDRIAPRLESLRAELGAPQSEDRVRVLEERLDRAHAALQLLIDTQGSGAWRRRTISVPGTGRPTSREVVGAQPEGLVVAANGGTELLAWSRFSAETGSLEQLFKGRLERAYTITEHRQILTLLAMAASLRAVPPAHAALDPAARRLLTPSDAEAMEAAFAPALDWLASTTETQLPEIAAEVRAENAAAKLLAVSIRAAQEEAWTHAAASLERLLKEYADTLVVLLLSDGSAQAEEASTQTSGTSEAADASGATGAAGQAGSGEASEAAAPGDDVGSPTNADSSNG